MSLADTRPLLSYQWASCFISPPKGSIYFGKIFSTEKYPKNNFFIFTLCKNYPMYFIFLLSTNGKTALLKKYFSRTFISFHKI